jgi:hypothetical protein
MQKLLNIGVDVGKDAVVVGCDEQGLPSVRFRTSERP